MGSYEWDNYSSKPYQGTYNLPMNLQVGWCKGSSREAKKCEEGLLRVCRVLSGLL